MTHHYDSSRSNDVDVLYLNRHVNVQDGMPVDGGLESYLCWGMTKAEVRPPPLPPPPPSLHLGALI